MLSSFTENNNQKQKMILETTAGDCIDWILDVTIAYPERIPLHLKDVVCGFRKPCNTHMHYRLYPSTEVRTVKRSIIYNAAYYFKDISYYETTLCSNR